MPINPYYRPSPYRPPNPFDEVASRRPELSPGLQPAPPPQEVGADFAAQQQYDELLQQPSPQMKPQSKWKQALGYAASAFFPFSHTDIPERLIVGDENLRARQQRQSELERAEKRAGAESERLKYGLESRRVATGEAGVDVDRENVALRSREADLQAERDRLAREKAGQPPPMFKLPPEVSGKLGGVEEVPIGAAGAAISAYGNLARPAAGDRPQVRVVKGKIIQVSPEGGVKVLYNSGEDEDTLPPAAQRALENFSRVINSVNSRAFNNWMRFGGTPDAQAEIRDNWGRDVQQAIDNYVSTYYLATGKYPAEMPKVSSMFEEVEKEPGFFGKLFGAEPTKELRIAPPSGATAPGLQPQLGNTTPPEISAQQVSDEELRQFVQEQGIADVEGTVSEIKADPEMMQQATQEIMKRRATVGRP